LGEMATLAPYVDSDHNGIYDPTGGDYPLIRGDEALYTIFNDARGVHTETGGTSLGIEVHLMAYQFQSADTTVNETTFLHYDIFNLSANPYYDVYFANWIDMDVGNGGDNYIGCDSANNYWYTYDGHTYDANGTGQFAGEQGYLNAPAAQSLAYLCDTMTHFMYYNNDFTVMGNPTTAIWYYDYMENIWGDNTHATYGGDGYGGSTNSNYMYSGNPPTNTALWSEITAEDVSGDRRGLSSTGPYTFNSGERKSLDLALVFSRGQNSYGNVYPVTQLGPRITDVRNFYNTQSYGCDETMLAVPEVKSNISGTTVLVYPNPTSGIFTVVLSHAELVSASQPFVEIYNEIGQKVIVATLKQIQTDNLIDLSNQPSGVYFYRVLTVAGKLIGDGKIVKQ
jgi:Secretion system C-terminal sorting domain